MLADIVLAVFARHIFGRVMKWAAVYPTASGLLTGLRHHQLLHRLQRRVSHEIAVVGKGQNNPYNRCKSTQKELILMKSLFEEMGGTYRQEGDYLSAKAVVLCEYVIHVV